MNANRYFNELEKFLKNLKNKDEVIKELKAVALDDDYDTLVRRFGKPEEMALNYLDEVPKLEKNTKLSKYIAIAFIAFFIFMFFYIKSFVSDPFDYSKYDENTIINKVTEYKWKDFNSVNKIDISQARVVIYFTNKNESKYSCDDKGINEESGKLNIRHNDCFLVLEKNKYEIKTYQANVVLVKPLDNLFLDSEQSSIELARKNQNYTFEIDKKESNVDDRLESLDNNKEIKIKLFQANFELYEY